MTVSKDTANRYFVSILVEEDIQPLPEVNKQVGLDLGLKSMVILSTGETVGNPKFFHQDEKKLARAQRRLAKKKKGPRTVPKPGTGSRACMRALLIDAVTINTSSRLASFVITKLRSLVQVPHG